MKMGTWPVISGEDEFGADASVRMECKSVRGVHHGLGQSRGQGRVYLSQSQGMI